MCKYQALPAGAVGWIGGWQTAAATRGHRRGETKARTAKAGAHSRVFFVFSELQGGTTQAEEEVAFRRKGRAKLEKVWRGEHMGPSD